MTQQKVEQMCKQMREAVNAHFAAEISPAIELIPWRFDEFPEKPIRQAQHALFMLDKIPVLHSDPERREKANRWIGFVQGWLCTARISSLESLKCMNMPDSEQYSKERL